MNLLLVDLMPSKKERDCQKRRQIEDEYGAVMVSSPPSARVLEQTKTIWKEKLQRCYRKQGRRGVKIQGDLPLDLYFALCWKVGKVEFKTKYFYYFYH